MLRIDHFSKQRVPMLPPSSGCADCPVRSFCLVNSEGLAGEDDAAVPRHIIDRQPGELVVNPGDPTSMTVVRSGWAARYVLFPDGRRQITDIVLPGDFVGCSDFASTSEELPMVALSDVQACIFDRSILREALSTSPKPLLAVFKTCGEQSIRLRHLLAAMGRQSGTSRVASFLMGLHHRLKLIGQATDCEMPYHLRQQDLADVLGITQEHVSRTMRMIQEADVLILRNKIISILNADKLERFARA